MKWVPIWIFLGGIITEYFCSHTPVQERNNGETHNYHYYLQMVVKQLHKVSEQNNLFNIWTPGCIPVVSKLCYCADMMDLHYSWINKNIKFDKMEAM